MKPTPPRGALLATLLAGAAAIASAQAPAAPVPSPAAGAAPPIVLTAPPVAAPAAAPDDSWKTATELPTVDFTGLSAAQKDTALALLRAEGCLCGCGMKIAECRVKDKNCPASPKLAAAVVQGIKDGKTADAIKASLGSVYQKPAPPPAQAAPPPTLGAAVDIPTAGAPFKGETTAKVILTEFSDFQ